MSDVNVAELRRVLEVPPVEYTVFPLGSNVPYIHKEQSTTVIVNRSTLEAVLDAYERDREAERRMEELRAHPDYKEAQKAAGKEPQPGTDEEIRAMIHGATPGGLQPTSRPSGDPPASLPPPNKHPKPIPGNPNRKASPHGRVHGMEPGEVAAPTPIPDDDEEEWVPVPEQVDLTKMPGYSMGYQAGFGERSKIPATWTRIIESVLARVLAGEPGAQVVADYPDEHGDTIEGLEKLERLLKAVEGVKPDAVGYVGLDELDAAYRAIKEATDA